MASRVPLDRQALAAFCRAKRIRRLSFFGSVLRSEFGPDSDVDVLVEFETDARPSLFEVFDMEEELSRILGGRKVDLRTPNDLSRYFRDDVLSRAEVQFAAG